MYGCAGRLTARFGGFRPEQYGIIYSSHFCANKDCPEVKRKLQDLSDGTGSWGEEAKGKGPKGPLAQQAGAVSGEQYGGLIPAEWTQEQLLERNKICGVQNGLLAGFSSHDSRVLDQLPEAVRQKYHLWRQKAHGAEGELTDDDANTDTLHASYGMPLVEATAETTPAIVDKSLKAMALRNSDAGSKYKAFVRARAP